MKFAVQLFISTGPRKDLVYTVHSTSRMYFMEDYVTTAELR